MRNLVTPSLTDRMPLEEWFDRYQYAVSVDIGESAVASQCIGDLALDTKALDVLRLRYGHHQGLPELRGAIAESYPGLDADDIVVTAGASEAIVTLAMTLLGPTSRAVVEHPTYPTLYRVPRALGADVRLFELRRSEHWRPNWSRLRRMTAAGVDMVAITHPNNPTGSIIDEQGLIEATAVAHDAGARLVSDETYRMLTFDTRLPPAASLDPMAISISTMSKAYGLPGLRIGWAATRDRDLVRRLVACREHLTITNNALGEQVALQVLRDQDHHLDRAQRHVTSNRAIAADAIRESPLIDWVAPEAGVVALPWLSGPTPERCLALYRSLAEERGAFVVPGSAFELPDTYFRLGFGAARDELRTGLRELRVALDELAEELA